MPGFKIKVPDDCRKCGLCCLPDNRYNETYVDLYDEDRERLLPHERGHLFSEPRVTGWKIRTWPLKNKTYGAKCYFLRGQPGRDCWCSIYPRRPALCRDFKRGGDECLEVLEYYQKGRR